MTTAAPLGKKFDLIRYFSVTSAVIIGLAVLGLGYFQYERESAFLIRGAEQRNVDLAKSLSHSIWPRFSVYMSGVSNKGAPAEGRPAAVREMDAMIRDRTRSFPVVKVKVFTPDGITAYSTDVADIGVDKSRGQGFRSARDGLTPVGKLTFRDTFNAFEGRIEDRNIVESYVPIQSADGHVQGVLELYSDVTALVEEIDGRTFDIVAIVFVLFTFLYASLFLIVNRAEQHLHRVTADWKKAEAELPQMQKLESLGSLTGGIAHNLNNLLQPIVSLSWQMKNDSLNGNGNGDAKNAEIVHLASQRATDLVRRLLLFSHKEEPKKTTVDIHGLVLEALSLLQATLPSQVTIDTELDDDAGTVLADESELQSVLLNILSNAIDSFEGGAGKITVRLAGGPSTTTITVADNGSGMDEETTTRIFDPFFTTKPQGKGTGLGLSTAFGIVRAHGGEIHCASQPGEGTVFTVELPANGAGPPSG